MEIMYFGNHVFIPQPNTCVVVDDDDLMMTML